jgi:hypothetical protein
VEIRGRTLRLQRFRGWWRLARWLAAVLLLVAGAVGLIVSGWAVCEDRLAAVGNQAVVRVCHSPALTDVPVLTGLLVVLLLLLPDLAEIGIPGFISLKRRVDDQEAKLAGLELQVEQSTDVRQTAAQEVDTKANALNVNYIDIEGALRMFLNKTGDEVSPTPETATILQVAPQRGQLEAQLLRAWAQLEPLVTLSEGVIFEEQLPQAEERVAVARHLYEMCQRDRARALEQMRDARPDKVNEAAKVVGRLEAETDGAADRLRSAIQHLMNLQARVQNPAGQDGMPLSSKELHALRAWRRDFKQEVDIVRAARHAVAHAQPIHDDKLADAVKLADGLLVAWDVRRSRIAPPTTANQAADGQQTAFGGTRTGAEET